MTKPFYDVEQHEVTSTSIQEKLDDVEFAPRRGSRARS
jgi:hypothetical protein